MCKKVRFHFFKRAPDPCSLNLSLPRRSPATLLSEITRKRCGHGSATSRLRRDLACWDCMRCARSSNRRSYLTVTIACICRTSTGAKATRRSVGAAVGGSLIDFHIFLVDGLSSFSACPPPVLPCPEPIRGHACTPSPGARAGNCSLLGRVVTSRWHGSAGPATR